MDFEACFALFESRFRETFGEDFDASIFRGDPFYAAQILEKAVLRGSPELQAVAEPLEAWLSNRLEAALPDADVMMARAEPAQPAPVTVDDDDNAPTLKVAPLDGVPQQPQAAAAPSPEVEAGAPSAEGENGAPRVARKDAPLSSRQVFLLSQLRIEYRKAFGTYFDVVEFSRNDLYARSVLKVCVESERDFLAALAGELLEEKDDARPIRRKGSADFELALH